ncbi:PREDICTED: protein GLUTAMINE DUMPER 3-like [Nelumbo nucifera]|uniref:Protein GLUTAMINE DUMPER 3-like n=2 Tax=Nelumbo nucifera TaxID=4432 RepID=A0A1U7ZH18_NELNU|nr:PREDICTED: protein GLUTAMINE DUMPER 3-like [Nelumbo nucifera]DAD45644.1 TPA_asm: hypothetical protein HUJ06_003874 [Nelumbo nucifera]
MRTGGTLSTTNSVSTATSTTTAPASAAVATGQHSPWHSPVPYLFGGLAAMLGLIAFALLILACSYWKLSGYLEGGEGGERDPESRDEKSSDAMKIPSVFEEKILVIMAGDEKPTYLATPISSKLTWLGDNSKITQNDNSNKDGQESGKSEYEEKPKTSTQEGSQQQETENRETQEQSH